MNYHPDDFLALIEEVEKQGGSHLNEPCKPTNFRLNVPIDEDNLQGPRVNKRFSTSGCRRRAKFIVQLLPDAYFDLVDLYKGQVTVEVRKDGTRVLRKITGEDFDFDDSSNPRATMSDGSPALGTFCAVDDAMGLWPRYQSAMHTGDSFQEQ